MASYPFLSGTAYLTEHQFSIVITLDCGLHRTPLKLFYLIFSKKCSVASTDLHQNWLILLQINFFPQNKIALLQLALVLHCHKHTFSSSLGHVLNAFPGGFIFFISGQALSTHGQSTTGALLSSIWFRVEEDRGEHQAEISFLFRQLDVSGIGAEEGEGICRSSWDHSFPCFQQSLRCRALAPLSLIRASAAERHFLFSNWKGL